MTVNCGKLDSFNGKIPVAKMPMEPIILPIQYHFLKENTVSTKGAQKILKHLEESKPPPMQLFFRPKHLLGIRGSQL